MDRKEEILEKLTGIQSSRLSYYAELTRAMEEMKKKSNQLRILNQLTKIHVNESWEGISRYLASQLRQAFDFDVFILSLCDASVVANHICWMENGQWLSRTQAMGDASRADMSTDVSDLIPWGREPQNRLSVPLQNQLGQRVGELILLNHAALQYSEEEFSFLQVAADYVGVVIENILLFKDLSKKVNLEAQLIQSAKLAALGEMAAGVAHELNSPLTAILGNVQLLMRGSSGEAAAQMLEDIYRCGLRCRKIIQNLLTFARQDEYAWESLNLNEVVGGVLELIGYQLQVSGITVQTRLSDDLPPFQGSRQQIEQVLINLLLNARDATLHREGARIEVETGTTELDGMEVVYVAVWDNGTGIKEEHLSQIFHPFFTTKERFRGTGLGLSVSHGIAESHGGKLLVESEEGVFSRFTLALLRQNVR